MSAPPSVDPQKIKERSESMVLAAGGRICDWLPVIDFTETRDLMDVVDRALVLNALLNLYFGAPSEIIAKWIDREGLRGVLSAKERELLKKPAATMTEQERIDIYWYIEALWAFMWATNVIEDMPFDRSVEDFMANLCPNLQADEDASKFRLRMKLRPYAELYAMRDLCFRFHWWTRDAHLNGQDTGAVRLDVVMERRRALEWILDRQSDWDDVPLNT